MTPLADTGRVIAGRYRLEAPIGRGAMGIVWRARDQLLDRDVAVKEVQLADTLSADERANAYQRTLREAKTAARLSHPGVVSVYDVADDDGRPWIVMELVHARSLDQVLALEGPLSPLQTAEIGKQLLSALSVAHNAGVLHRDVKPSNVLLGQDGRAVLTDFGIATFQGDPKLTQTGMVMGSPGFTAPERIRGGPATPASDLWSLGATLYAAVQGHGPYESRGGAITTMSAIINEDAPAAPAAGQLSRVIEALLRREPAERPDASTATRMIADILPQLSDRPAENAGYEPTSLSAAAPGGSPGDAMPAASTSMDPASQQPVQASKQPVPDGAAAAQVPYPASAWGTPAASVSPPTMPQPTQDDTPAPVASRGGLNHPSSQPPDFSSWYSTARPADQGTASGSADSQSAAFAGQQSAYPSQQSGYGAAQTHRDASAWPQAPPSSTGQAPRQGGASAAGQGPASGGTRRRWLLILLALAIIGAGAGAATVFALRQSSSTTAATAGASTSPQGTGGASATAPGAGTSAPDDIAKALDSPSSTAPAGFTRYTLPPSSAGTTAGFALSYPSAWTVSRSGYQTYFRDPALNAYVLVDLTPHTFPGDMLREARYIKLRSTSGHPGYRQLGTISRLSIRGAAGAQWRFTYTNTGGPQEALDLLWVASTSAGSQSYAMYFTAPAANWASLRPMFSAMAQSFLPVTG